MRFDPATPLQPVQRRVQRSLLNFEEIVRDLLDALGNGPAVQRTQRYSFQNQQIQSALGKIDSLLGHNAPCPLLQEDSPLSVEVQGEGGGGGKRHFQNGRGCWDLAAWDSVPSQKFTQATAINPAQCIQ